MSEEPTSNDLAPDNSQGSAPDPAQGAAASDPGGPPPLTPEEQEMLEKQMAEVRVEDLLTQTVASVLNLSARRIVKEDEVDLDQARIGIDAVRALVALLPPEVGEAVREPLSQVQMLYAQRAGGEVPGENPPDGPGGPPPGGADGPGGPPPGGPAGDGPPSPPEPPASPGPDSGPPKGPGLWTPRGS